MSISLTVNGVVTDIRWIGKSKNETGLIFSCADGSLHAYVRNSVSVILPSNNNNTISDLEFHI